MNGSRETTTPGTRFLSRVALTAIITAAIAPAAAEDAGRHHAPGAAVLVFDASGSMWGQLRSGESKIATARKVISEFFATRDAATPLGLIAYGHRQRGNCADIEVIAPTAMHDAATLATHMANITPKGMTLIGDSLRLAAEQIPPTAEFADIILVTDGLETCNADPCAVASDLARAGVTIRAHVVGFGLTDDEATALSCVTEQTGGILLRPHSGAELAESLRQINAAIPEPAPQSAPLFDIGPTAEAGYSYRIAYRGTARNDDFAGFTPRGEGRPTVGPSFGPIGGGATANNPFTKRAPEEPGEYDLILDAADGSGIVARQPIDVVAASSGFDPIGSVAPDRRFNVTWRGPDQLGQRIVIARPGDPPETYTDSWGHPMSNKGRMGLRAPVQPGTYEMRYLAAGQRQILFSRQFGVGVPHEDVDGTGSDERSERAATSTRGDVVDNVMPHRD